LFWWALLIPTGWCLFLPGVLDHLKFTDGLVSHSLMAMAGFVTSLLILVLAVPLNSCKNCKQYSGCHHSRAASIAIVVVVTLFGRHLEPVLSDLLEN